jgi:hypothetical protein
MLLLQSMKNMNKNENVFKKSLFKKFKKLNK